MHAKHQSHVPFPVKEHLGCPIKNLYGFFLNLSLGAHAGGGVEAPQKEKLGEKSLK
jgi:hypothetical protein